MYEWRCPQNIGWEKFPESSPVTNNTTRRATTTINSKGEERWPAGYFTII